MTKAMTWDEIMGHCDGGVQAVQAVNDAIECDEADLRDGAVYLPWGSVEDARCHRGLSRDLVPAVQAAFAEVGVAVTTEGGGGEPLLLVFRKAEAKE